MQYNCNIVANNNTDFVIADNITSGTVPMLGSGYGSFVTDINFDIILLLYLTFFYKHGNICV